MRIGWSPPIAERRVVRPGVEEGAEVVPRLLVQDVLGAFYTQFRCIGRDPVGELVEVPAGGLVAGSRRADRRVQRPTRTPDLVLVADKVAALFEFERKRRYGLVPDCALEDRAEAGLPEVLPGEDRASARCAGWSRHQSVEEQRAFGGDPIEVGRADQGVQRSGSLVLGVGVRVPTPIVGEGEQDVGSFHECSS